MKYLYQSTIALILPMIFWSCNKFEFSPYQTEISHEMPRNLNSINISKLKQSETNSDDTVTILYSGDSQRFYDELDNLVDKVNARTDIDFFILCGDISDFGTLQEFLWVTRELEELRVPYMCAIGNHDLTANGEQVYNNVFGEKYFSFNYKQYRFLFHDTNGREYGFNGTTPNLWWLTEELKDTSSYWFVGISHVPPYDVDFDKALEIPYKNILASKNNFILSLHGHLHGTSDSYFYNDSVRYMTSNSVNKNEALILKLINGEIIKQYLEY